MFRSASEVMDALGEALRARNLESIRALYADNVRVWHASTGVEQDKEENPAICAQQRRPGLLGRVFMSWIYPTTNRCSYQYRMPNDTPKVLGSPV